MKLIEDIIVILVVASLIVPLAVISIMVVGTMAAQRAF